MRTRRSWRNQDRLWTALGGRSPPAPPVDPVALAERVLARAKAEHLGARTIRQLEADLQRARRKALRKDTR